MTTRISTPAASILQGKLATTPLHEIPGREEDQEDEQKEHVSIA